MFENQGIIVQNPSREHSSHPRRLRSFPPSALFQFAVNDLGDDFIYSIDHLRLQYESMELSRNISFWRFADGTCAFSYLTDSDDEKTRHFASQPWELHSIARELHLQLSYA